MKNINYHIKSLQRFAKTLPELLDGITEEQARWKPADGAWSILEIVTHLADEEVEDFRTRVKLTLENPENCQWPPINPVGWAEERKYNQGQLHDSLSRFYIERTKSLEWLISLATKNPQWSNTYNHPEFGPIHAGDVMVSWTAHDLLHLRQITKRLFQLTQINCDNYTTVYAGEW